MNQNPEKIQVADIIGQRGTYQIISAVVAFYLVTLSGGATVFLQFYTPFVQLSTPGNMSETFSGTNCSLEYLRNLSATTTLKYISQYSDYTLTEKLTLICEDAWFVTLSAFMMMLGSFFGGIIFGQLSERYGRRKIYTLLLIPCLAANVMILFPLNVFMLALSCFVFGSGIFPIYRAVFITVMEIVPTSKRQMYGTIFKYASLLGQALLASFAWIFKNWFYTQIAQTLMVAVAVPISWYVLESPLWLAVKGDSSASKDRLKRIMKRNDMLLTTFERTTETWLHDVQKNSLLQKTQSEGSMSDLWKTSVMRKHMLCLGFIMISSHLADYSLMMNVETFGSSLFADFMVSICLALVSMIIATVSLYFISVRVLILTLSSLLTLVCTIYPFVQEWGLARSVLCSLARCVVAPLANSAYTYAFEVLPTSVTGIGLAVVASFARLASAISPFTRELAIRTSSYVPMLIYGILNLLASLTLFFVLPETRNRPLVHTVNELKELNQKSRSGTIKAENCGSVTSRL